MAATLGLGPQLPGQGGQEAGLVLGLGRQQPSTALGLKQDPPSTGDEQVDKMIRAEMAKVEGFPLKRVTVTRTADANGDHSSRSEMNVLEVKQVRVPEAVFAMPRGYKEVPPKRVIEE